ncbi:MAG TPA: ABC transporter permease [Chitinophagaceae bacterium]|nr:ABC transporter permease [Chitinophagaceae bacterium]
MLRSAFVYAFRQLRSNRVFTGLNILGLLASLTAFILMVLFIEDELQFDRFHANAENIYRVEDEKETNNALVATASSAAPVAPALLREFPEVKQAVRMIKTEALVKNGDQLFEERKIFYADSHFFDLFSFPLLSGSSATALANTDNIVLTASMAMKYFAGLDVVGKTLLVDGKSMIISGVLQDIPRRSHLSFDFLISMATAEENGSGYEWMFSNWYSNNFYTYISLKDKQSLAGLSRQLPAFDLRHREAQGHTVHHYTLVPLTAVYLRSGRGNQPGKTGSYTNIYIFTLVALFILLIACVNFINLSTATAQTRAKEIAIKKVAGASRWAIVTQFMAESFLTVTVSMALALLAAALLLPWFNGFVDKQLQLNLGLVNHAVFITALVFVMTLLAGSYPAFILSQYKPAASLKGNVAGPVMGAALRKGLVVFQFTASVVLIICVSVMYAQLKYLQQHELGFSIAQKLVINFEGDASVRQQLEHVKHELLKIPGVEGATASSNVPGDGRVGSWSMNFAKNAGDTSEAQFAIYLTDFDFIQRYGIRIVEGRAFSRAYGKDSAVGIIINEAAVKKLGLRSAAEAIGMKVGMYPTDAKVIGVMGDFHYESLQKAVEPICLRILPSNLRVLTLDITTSNMRQTMAAIMEQWKILCPQRPLEYAFLNESYNRQYAADTKFGQLFGLFTVLAIIIASLGLFGLASFSISKRRKEIGIRKVLGAGVLDIALLTSRQFLLLVLLSVLIAIPIGGWCMQQWLLAFSSRISLSFWLFLQAGAIALLIAVSTVSSLAVKAALANPARSISTE